MSDIKVSNKVKSGLARAASLTPAQRKTISAKAVAAKAEIAKLPKATHGAPDKPLKIGDIEIQCYVLADGLRVLSQRGVIGGLGMSRGSSGGGGAVGGGDRLASFIGTKSISPFVNNELLAAINNPIKFVHGGGGGVVFGYPATLLADICDSVLRARKEGKLHLQQSHIAEQCELLVRGFARVGIIALVDEATGYQKDRAKDALAQILESFVAKELQPYMKTFPADYYEQLFRLRGLPYPPEVTNFRPQYFGKLTNDIIYKRIAPGLLLELKKKNDKDEKKGKLHQRLTVDVGYQKLRDHLAATVMAMKLSKDYPDFISTMNRFYPRFGDSMMLDLEDEDKGAA